MKKYINKIIILVATGVMLSLVLSCDKDELLDKGSKTILSGDDISGNLDKLVTGAYDVLQWQNTGVNVGNAQHIFPVMWQGIRADDMVSQWATYWGPGLLLDDLSLIKPNNSNIEALWGKWFTGIARSNSAIAQISASEIADKERLIAEAKFVRAFCYFELVRHFGGVPLYTENLSATDDLKIPRATSDEVYGQVEKDLEEAIPNLLSKGETEQGRATKGAAQSLLAKVHLEQGEYADVLTYTNAVIASGEYALEPNFADNFKQENEYGIESVFEIGYVSGANTGYFESVGTAAEGSSSYQMFGYIFNGSNGGFGNSVPRPELINLYDDGDTRKDATFIMPSTVLENGPQSCDCLQFNSDGSPVFGAAGNESQWIGTDIYNYFWLVNNNSWISRASMRKYSIPQAVAAGLPTISQTGLNEKVIRYAEVLLMHAEASLFAPGATALSGQAAFDMVRNRAYGGSAPSMPLTLENLKLERRKELATEGWNRFTDLVRWGDAASTLAFKNFQAGRDELLPIPQSEIDIVGPDILPQNPGY